MSDTTTESATARRVVVGYDTSGGAVRAVRVAATVAVERGLGLTILMAARDLDATATRTARNLRANPAYLDELRAAVQAKIDAFIATLAPDYPGLDVRTVLTGGNPAGVLSEASKDAALVVVGARGNTAGHRTPMLGGVSTAVIAHSEGPVLVVPETASPNPQGPVVLGLQDAPDARAAGEIAAREAEIRGVPLVAIYAWDISPELGDLGALAVLDPVKTQHDLESMLTELLAPITAGHENLVVERRVVQGSARSALVEASHSAVLIVLGSRGLGGFAGLMLGSISRSVTREAACPVLVVRYRGHDAAES
ncbi:MAG: universal stress protein [Actinomycetia bacterium]|nr:universal stress protein [Actinomycetes bacterium]